ncbi:MBL fold metallo-hydrolase [Geomicrobium sp. JCM 19055]|uniref:MBL fold metallo-hydrolase n=1 Tax=Geomicrobium sp. JCM 19055 TaxID=1460649 RepID=UPI002235525C|nr:MBL fold metallo-hydrolase [Geomicrobium sp. JCM 19055]
MALTHNHEDHSGNVAVLANQRELPVYVHELGLEECFLETPYPYYRQLAWGERKPFQPSKMPDQLTTSNATWDVIFTPGHAKDHISLLDEQTGRLFTGDLFVTPKPKVIMEAESIPETLRSLKKLLNYEFSSIFCCHSGYHINGKEMVNKKIEHLEALIAQVHELTEQGYSIDDIDRSLYPKTYPIETVSEGQWSSRHIVSSIVKER